MADDKEHLIDVAFKPFTTEHGPTAEAFGRVPNPELKEKMIADVRARLDQWYNEHSAAETIKDDFSRKNKLGLVGARVETDIQEIMWKAVKANERLDGKPERGSLSPEAYARKLREDLKARTDQEKPRDLDRER